MSIQCLKLAVSYFPHKRVSSLQTGLTSVFGMRTGVTPQANHQIKKLNIKAGQGGA